MTIQSNTVQAASGVRSTSSEDAAHTPTPWELIEATEHHGAYIVNSWGRTICDLYTMSNPMAASVRNGGTSFPVHFDDMVANAAFIVKAVNSHDALVKALKSLTNEMLGIWDAFEHGLRAEISNTNYVVAHEKLVAAEQVLAAVQREIAR